MSMNEMPVFSKKIDAFLKLTVLITILKIWPISFLFLKGEPVSSLLSLVCVASAVFFIIGIRRRAVLIITGVSYSLLYSQHTFNILYDGLLDHHSKLLFITWALIILYLSFFKNYLIWLEKNLKFLAIYIYLCAILVKLNMPFLSGFRLQQIMAFTYFDSTAFSTLFAQIVFKGLSILTIVTEVFIVLLFISSNIFLRRLGVVLCVGFHVGLHLALPVDTFSLQMAALGMLFWERSESLNFSKD